MQAQSSAGPRKRHILPFVLMLHVVAILFGCDSPPMIPVPPELTPGMSLYINQHIDSVLDDGNFEEVQVPTFINFSGAPLYAYRSNVGGVQKSIQLYTPGCDRRVTGAFLSWEWHRKIDSLPTIDSLPQKYLAFLRSKYNHPMPLEEYDYSHSEFRDFHGTWVVDEFLRIDVYLTTMEGFYRFSIHFYNE